MTRRRTRLEVELGARDNASATVDDLADKVDRLEDGDKVIALRGQVDHAEREIRKLERQLGRVDKYDGEQIDLIVEARDNARAKLEDAQRRLAELDGKTARVDVDVDDSELDGALDKIDDLLGGRLGAAGPMASRLGIGGAVAAGFILAGDAAADAAVSVDNLSKLTGDTVENASRLQGVMQRAGVESTDLQDILLQMGGVLADDAELAADLGINLADGRTLGERFVQVVELLGDRFTDAGERSLVAARLFGEEGVRQVNAVTAAYPDLQAAVDEYSGKVYTATDAARAREYQTALAEIKDEFKAVGMAIGTDVLPMLSTMLETVVAINDVAPGEGGLMGQLVQASPLSLLNKYNTWLLDTVGLIDDAEHSIDDARGALRTMIPTVDEWVEALRGGAPAAEETRSAVEMINREIELAIDNFRRFGADGVENMNAVTDAAEGTRRQVGDNAPPVTFRVAGGERPYLTGPTGPNQVIQGNLIIHNPPGTPAATADQARVYNARNGYR